MYLPDVAGAIDVFAAIPGATFYYFSHTLNPSPSIAGFGPAILPNTTIDACPQLDVIILGASHPRYLYDPILSNFLFQQVENTSAVITVCAGTFIPGTRGFLQSRNATTNYHQTVDLKKVGACYQGKLFEADGKFFSAGPAVGSYVAAMNAVKTILGEEWAAYIQNTVLQFFPKPIFGTTPQNAPRSIKILSDFLSIFLRNIYSPAIKKGTKRASHRKKH